MNPKISVIVPVYNVSAYLSDCCNSLLSQTFNDFEVVFVLDAPTDDSKVVLTRCIEGTSIPVTVIEHEYNKGLPAARNTGLAIASGEYISHCDADDKMSLDMLERMYNAAKEANADYVWCDYYMQFSSNKRYMKQPGYQAPDMMLKTGLLGGRMKYNVWNKLVKRSLYVDNDIRFPEGHSMGEDMTMIRLAACAKRIAYVPDALYHYNRTNVSSYTLEWNDKHADDILFNVNQTAGFLVEHCKEDISAQLAWFKLNVKYPFLVSGERSDFDRWRSWFRETDNYINIAGSPFNTREKVLQSWAITNCWLLIKLYTLLMNTVVYKIRYR